ncbi:type II secretion system protein [Amycolatopsis mediterranei S699]|uniref:Type II secretion system protein n=2 Tax=Amycolatopsis mediterranei TaxID=33910 RepID=A0A0H3DJW2_AMYMU|nr:type II secretion system protein [Amycolatopsis mediterranei]ADJ50497.1 type II secretion system protein [Amycolatopsis mediterranei U32]AEK47502.1 type II secretion system protein [Amycolatopsis mediterranei S699]AFO82203.1 type II secretion system protein [Amycolatopsis mediterranei S699]AGT89332.1 type II secretion system protein [Amycolatopsis mediterranei RB]KDO09545.1 type II secretion system protein [Amycolatopsis mediterranei]
MITPWFPLCVGAALACWPAAPNRLQVMIEPPATVRVPQVWRAVRWLLPAALAGLLAGVGGAIAAGVLTLAWSQEWRAHRRATADLTMAAHTATALRTMVAELRSGAHPVTAAEAAAEVVPAVAGDLRALATAARLDTEVPAPALPRLAAAWTLAKRHGLPMADVLDAARRDAEAGLAFGRRMRAKLAGPRASAAVLTGLPVLCVLLGQAMGAAPLSVLTGSTPGQVLLVAGCVLLWAGTAWCRALSGRVRIR